MIAHHGNLVVGNTTLIRLDRTLETVTKETQDKTICTLPEDVTTVVTHLTRPPLALLPEAPPVTSVVRLDTSPKTARTLRPPRIVTLADNPDTSLLSALPPVLVVPLPVDTVVLPVLVTSAEKPATLPETVLRPVLVDTLPVDSEVDPVVETVTTAVDSVTWPLPVLPRGVVTEVADSKSVTTVSSPDTGPTSALTSELSEPL